VQSPCAKETDMLFMQGCRSIVPIGITGTEVSSWTWLLGASQRMMIKCLWPLLSNVSLPSVLLSYRLLAAQRLPFMRVSYLWKQIRFLITCCSH